eukprot:SAG31_NODE_3059_length_4678_cov_1.833657_8_plen_193_part_00
MQCQQHRFDSMFIPPILEQPNRAKELSIRLGKELSRHELGKAMAEMDNDGSGAVSSSEFGTFWRQHAQKHRSDLIRAYFCNIALSQQCSTTIMVLVRVPEVNSVAYTIFRDAYMPTCEILRREDVHLVRAAGGMEPIVRQVWKTKSLKEKRKWGERAVLQLRREKQEKEAKENAQLDPLGATMGHGTKMLSA